MPRVAGRTVNEATVHDESSPDAGRDNHREVRVIITRGAVGAFGERQRARVAVYIYVYVESLTKLRSQGKISPRDNVERRDQFAPSRHRSRAADAEHGDVLVASDTLEHVGGWTYEVNAKVVNQQPFSAEHGAIGPYQRSFNLGCANIQGQTRSGE
jgi:hypothetical protein